MRLFAYAVLAALLFAVPAHADDGAEGKRALAALKAGGHYGLMRHAHAAGIDEPPGAQLGDCGMQRNLDDAGKAQARAVGEGLRRAGVTIFKLYAGRWCRTMETAELMAVGDVEALDILNAFTTEAAEREQTRHLAALVGAPIATPSVLLVTHHDNIMALLRLATREGDIVVVKPMGGGKHVTVGLIRAGELRD